MSLPIIGKFLAAATGLGALTGSCAHAVDSGVQGAQSGVANVGGAVTKVENYTNPRTCEDTVDGTTATTIIDGTTFGAEQDAHGRWVITRELGKCNR